MAAESKKVIVAALLGNMMVAVTKFVATAMTGSSAMFSEAIHSVVDTGNQVLMLYGLKRAAIPADEHFPFGHGKEIYFWSFVVAIMIFGVGAGLSFYEGVHSLQKPTQLENPLVNYIVLSLAIIFEGAAWLFAWKAFSRQRGKLGLLEAVQEGKDPTLFVVLFEDSAAMTGLLVALIGIALTDVTGNPVFDSIASLLIGLILALTAVWLAYETKGLLIGESADPEVIRGIKKMALSFREIRHINEVLTMHMGPNYILVNLSVEFTNSANADDIENTVAQLDRTIKGRFPNVKRVFIEAEARRFKA
ncbi:MAG: cation diffusion facilitator family transporter [Pseudomonadota bacterium]|nr:cation diffusion facilitator family transporter [Pseudomonadota bacterium]